MEDYNIIKGKIERAYIRDILKYLLEKNGLLDKLSYTIAGGFISETADNIYQDNRLSIPTEIKVDFGNPTENNIFILVKTLDGRFYNYRTLEIWKGGGN